MSYCCICQKLLFENGKNLFVEYIGDPPKIIGDIIINSILSDIGHCYEFSEDCFICKQCERRISNYYNSLRDSENIKKEILNLMTLNYGDVLPFDEIKIDEAEAEELSADKLYIVNSMDIDAECIDKRVVSMASVGENISDGLHLNPLKNKANVNSRNNSDSWDNSYKYMDNFMIDTTKPNSNASIHCLQCSMVFEKRRELNKHVKEAHFTGYICDICGKVFQTSGGLTSHRVTHEEKTFKCIMCSERFHHKYSLKHHMAWHSEEKPFQCEVCLKRFVHKLALKKHNIIHDENSRKKECKICKNKFRSLSHLKRHLRTHTGVKQFACKICGRRFAENYNLIAHMRDHEGTKRRLRCKTCHRIFANAATYREHCEFNCIIPNAEISN